MGQLTDGSRVVLAGDFGRYIVRDVTTPVIIRAVEKFADDGLVGFKIDSRHDGRIADLSAFKILKPSG
jgi:HK97 family phage major capsid protein